MAGAGVFLALILACGSALAAVKIELDLYTFNPSLEDSARWKDVVSFGTAKVDFGTDTVNSDRLRTLAVKLTNLNSNSTAVGVSLPSGVVLEQAPGVLAPGEAKTIKLQLQNSSAREITGFAQFTVGTQVIKLNLIGTVK